MGNRSVRIEVKNDTKDSKLMNPEYYLSSGQCKVPPLRSVNPGATEVSYFKKISGAACGAVGVLTADITTLQGKADKQLAIMFCVPFNYNHFDNMFALGLFEPGERKCNESLYNLMYEGSANEFKRAKASHGRLKHEGEDYIIEGTMSNDSESIIEVELSDAH